MAEDKQGPARTLDSQSWLEVCWAQTLASLAQKGLAVTGKLG